MARPSVFVAMACYDTMKVETCLSLLNLFNKFKQDNALLSQEWVMEPKKKVHDIIKELNIIDLKIKDFYRLKIGE